MKRSEMVIDLAGVLTIELMDREVFMNWDKVQNIANEILSEAEYNGMLPPNRPIIIELEPPYVENLQGVTMVAQIENSNTWEPENETK